MSLNELYVNVKKVNYINGLKSKMKNEEEIARLNAISSITAALLQSGHYEIEKLPSLVKKVSQALFGDNKPIFSSPVETKEMRGKDGRVLSSIPKIPVSESVHEDYVVCLLDGMKFKSMKRHLTTAYGITPNEYRQLFSLPDSYPLVCSNYKSKRSQLAKNRKR